jgi:outer membrane lipoprotein SlyB
MPLAESVRPCFLCAKLMRKSGVDGTRYRRKPLIPNRSSLHERREFAMMPIKTTVVCGFLTLVALSGCAMRPMGPTVAVMPAPNKPFEAFQDDVALCKQFAAQQVSGQAKAANDQALGAGVLGTALGAGLGAAVGGGRGAAVGAATGAIAGGVTGAGNSQEAQLSIQQRYDIAYSQCMYSRGNQVPGFRPPPVRRRYEGYPPPPPPDAPPPPPPDGY